MHPEVVSDTPDHCPECGMKLIRPHSSRSGLTSDGSTTDTSTGDEHITATMQHAHGHSTTAMSMRRDGIEWEDDMVEINRITTPANMRWKLIDRDTGAENHAIDWRFRVGDQVKLRLVNEMDSDHPMHHPFHIHGAGRFLVLARDGASRRTSSGRTPCSCAPARPSTSCSTSPTPAAGWRTATSPNTTRAE